MCIAFAATIHTLGHQNGQASSYAPHVDPVLQGGTTLQSKFWKMAICGHMTSWHAFVVRVAEEWHIVLEIRATHAAIIWWATHATMEMNTLRFL